MATFMRRTLSITDLECHYCSQCDEYFEDKRGLLDHIQFTSSHPSCKKCCMRFLNHNSLREHYRASSRHYYCRFCDKLFSSSSALRVHLTYSQFHHDWDVAPPKSYARICHLWERNIQPGWEEKLAKVEDELLRNDVVEDEIDWEKVVDDAIIREKRSEKPKDGFVKSKIAYFNDLRAVHSSSKASTVPKLSTSIPKKKKRSPGSLKHNCPICMCSPRFVSLTRCGHMCCPGCLSKSFQQDHEHKCPSCRKRIESTDLRKVDLKPELVVVEDDPGVVEA